MNRQMRSRLRTGIRAPRRKAVLTRKVPEVCRHAQTEKRASQDRRAEHDPRRHVMARPHEEPREGAPEESEQAAHEQGDGPEAHEKRRRKIDAQAPQQPPQRRCRSVRRHTKCPEVHLHPFQLVGIWHAHPTPGLALPRCGPGVD